MARKHAPDLQKYISTTYSPMVYTAEIARELGVVGVVVGVPVNMDGSFGPRAQHAQKFANILQYKLGDDVHVATLDERMTTMAASVRATFPEI